MGPSAFVSWLGTLESSWLGQPENACCKKDGQPERLFEENSLPEAPDDMVVQTRHLQLRQESEPIEQRYQSHHQKQCDLDHQYQCIVCGKTGNRSDDEPSIEEAGDDDRFNADYRQAGKVDKDKAEAFRR